MDESRKQKAQMSHLEDCLNEAVSNGMIGIKSVKHEAERLYRLKYDSIDFLLKHKVYKNYFGE